MDSPDRAHRCAAELHQELREAGRMGPHWSALTPLRCHRASPGWALRCGAVTEMQSAALAAHWLRRAAPAEPGETDRPGAERTDAPVTSNSSGTVGVLVLMVAALPFVEAFEFKKCPL